METNKPMQRECGEGETYTFRERVDFICEYIACLMGSGVHTSRTIRNSKRIAQALGVGLQVSTFPKSFIMDITDVSSGESCNRVVEIAPLPISFEYNSELSILSWDAVDDHLPFPEIKKRFYDVVSRRRMNPTLLLLLVGAANASFCRLFGGDWASTLVVFLATLLGFFIRTRMQARHTNHYIVFITSAFVASLAASSILLFGSPTSGVAISTSVLYLVPGVPLINGVIDILEGYSLTGFSRLMNAALLIICIAIGLSLTLWMVKSSLL